MMSSPIKTKQSGRFFTIFILFFIIATIVPFLPVNIILLVLGGMVGTAVLLLFIQRPQWFIFFLIFYIPLEEFIQKWIPRGTLYEIARFGGEGLLLIILLFVLLEKMRRGFLWQRNPLDLPLLLFFIVVFVSGIINKTPLIVGLLGIRPLIRYVMVYYILVQMGVSQKFFQKSIKWTYIVAATVVFIGLLQTIIGMPLTQLLIPGDVLIGDVVARQGLRHVVSARTFIFSTLGRYDTLGIYLSLHLLVAYALLGVADKPHKRYLRLFILFALFALILTYSRQSWIVLILGLGIISFLSPRRLFVQTRLVYILIALLLPMLYFVLRPYAAYLGAAAGVDASVFERIVEPLSPQYIQVSRYSYGRLFVIFEVGSRLLSLAPIWGLGPGQFGSLVTRFFGIPFNDVVGVPDSAAHFINDVNWIIILGQVGLAGVITYLAIYLNLAKSAYRYSYKIKQTTYWREKGVALGYVACIFVFLILGFFGPNFEVRQSSFYIWLWGGLLIGRRYNTDPFNANNDPQE
ncbi:MAG TPA: hypothetical protein PLD25_15685 [Chloroflexota bacterium]|nr:hypothetical protein [Chloroflexota bacterium]HUM67649.1 hypothetical protein [Chloroflexota bacterium]